MFQCLSGVQSAMQKGTQELQEAIMLCWGIWKNRNEIVWQQRGSEFSEVCKSAKLFLNQWKNAQDKSFNHFIGFMNQEDGNVHWEHPQEGTVKINVDAVIFENSASYCVAMVARDHYGGLVAAKSSCRGGYMTPELAEAIGIKEALSWVKDTMEQPASIETDCLTIVQAIRCSSINFSYLGRVVDECKSLLSDLQNRHVTLKFLKRSANKLAHFLARQNSSIVDRMWNSENVSSDFYNVLNNDLKF
ncbi:uncharacterized protein LOC141696125 [Apium graveolens]|uniref:uncharacterized protein LOC141696125 n=1 Tax=Apium graveolens TaxID=4045 RepID=UPI003D79701D